MSTTIRPLALLAGFVVHSFAAATRLSILFVFAADPAFAAKRRELSEQLLKRLRDANDPRVTGDGKTYDQPPFSNPEHIGAKGKKQAK